jgi:hypothetical protein
MNQPTKQQHQGLVCRHAKRGEEAEEGPAREGKTTTQPPLPVASLLGRHAPGTCVHHHHHHHHRQPSGSKGADTATRHLRFHFFINNLFIINNGFAFFLALKVLGGGQSKTEQKRSAGATTATLPATPAASAAAWSGNGDASRRPSPSAAAAATATTTTGSPTAACGSAEPEHAPPEIGEFGREARRAHLGVDRMGTGLGSLGVHRLRREHPQELSAPHPPALVGARCSSTIQNELLFQ